MSMFDIQQPSIDLNRFNIFTPKKPDEPSFLDKLSGALSSVGVPKPKPLPVTAPTTKKQTFKDVADLTIHPITHAIGTLALTAGHALAPNNIPDILNPEQSNNPKIARAIFGEEPIRAIGPGGEGSKTVGFLKEKGIPGPIAGTLGYGLAGGAEAFNAMNPLSGVGKKTVEKIIASKTEQEVASHLAEAGIADHFSPFEIKNLASTTDKKAVEDLLSKKAKDLGVSTAEPKPSVSEATLPKQQELPLATPLEKAQQPLESAATKVSSPQDVSLLEPLDSIVQKVPADVKSKVNILDYLKTPEIVLKKIGLADHAAVLRGAYDSYLKELPQNINKITDWSKEVPGAESNQKIFQWLNGNKQVPLSLKEAKVAGEIKTWLSGWADRLGLPKDERLNDYITHIFPLNKAGEFDQDLAKIITNKVPGSVFNPFLLQRKGAEGYIEDTWKALDAYVKRATRKVNMDPALAGLKEASNALELSQFNYVKRFADRVNLRPTEIDNLIDNGIKQVVGYRFGARPVASLTSSARKIVSRAKLGLSFTSAFKNLTQGVNTFAELGTRYTTKGYFDLLTKGVKELKDTGVLQQGFIEDRSQSAVKKFWESADKGIFANFQATEAINRGAAYYGAKAKGLAQGMTEQEAIDYGKKIAAKTQFQFGSIDTPVALGSDIAKTLAQFQTFGIKQIEFLGGKLKNKEYRSLARYVAASALVFGTIGKAFGMNMWDLVPSLRFGTPPVLDLPVRTVKDVTGAKDQYGKTPSGKARLRDFLNAVETDLVPGGAQLNRTIEGLKAVSQGKSTTAAGKEQYPIAQTPMNYIRGALFGKSNLPEAQKYYNKKPTKTIQTNRFNTY